MCKAQYLAGARPPASEFPRPSVAISQHLRPVPSVPTSLQADHAPHYDGNSSSFPSAGSLSIRWAAQGAVPHPQEGRWRSGRRGWWRGPWAGPGRGHAGQRLAPSLGGSLTGAQTACTPSASHPSGRVLQAQRGCTGTGLAQANTPWGRARTGLLGQLN